MEKQPSLFQHLQEKFGSMGFELLNSQFSETLLSETQFSETQEITLEVPPAELLSVASTLKEDPNFKFEMLMDLCGVDYLEYGISEWMTDEATTDGFSRGVEKEKRQILWTKPRFAVVYHLLSLSHNHRLRIKTFVEEKAPIVPSVIPIWNSANWYEREAYDLFGIFFEGHPDLRRLLTDYGFIGHPFRKDFPLIGKVEVRYSARDRRVIYQPVTIPPRTLVPKTIRDDHRYLVDPPNLGDPRNLGEPPK